MKHFLKITVLLLLLSSCQITKMAVYDSYSHQKTVALKVRTNKLIAQATQSYTAHSSAMELLTTELTLLYEYEKSRPNNTVTIAMWSRLVGNPQTLIPKFTALWKEKDQLNPAFAEASTKQLNDVFDQIITLETRKEK